VGAGAFGEAALGELVEGGEAGGEVGYGGGAGIGGVLGVGVGEFLAQEVTEVDDVTGGIGVGEKTVH
jgi:hypothetical protein